MAKETKTTSQIIIDHKPKHYKFKYIIKDDTLIEELENAKFDLSTLDTINDTDLTVAALNANFKSYEREVVASAKKPTLLDNTGVILSKQMITKADKKLQSVDVGFFTHNNIKYVCVKFVYERFDIIEIFIIT